MSSRKSLFSIFVCGLLILASIGCSGKVEAEKTAEASKTSENDIAVAKTLAPLSMKDTANLPPKQQADEAGKLPDDAPVEKMPIAEFIKLTESTEQDELLKRFDGKWVELSGIVTGISSVESGRKSWPRVILTENGNILQDTSLQCYTRDLLPWNHFSIKDSVILRGILAKDIYDVETVLDHCKLISTKGTPVPRVSALDIAKSFAESAEMAESKFTAPQYIVTGKVNRIGGLDHLYLEGDGKYEVKVDFLAIETQDLKAGDMITVHGALQVNIEPEEGSHLLVKPAANITQMDRKE